MEKVTVLIGGFMDSITFWYEQIEKETGQTNALSTAKAFINLPVEKQLILLGKLFAFIKYQQD